ncbi:ABC transporter substrate-binding protein [Sabulicella glaciei]|uniref:ABC transporter substrate-binding protein n=1 Tax=Sabulicella glaciei TaxID=2984948 RepID=A0ABT3NV66_9PROT|nr:ABC transporter substrate-binding protein [Roseococcus sp. MDT2-1-1]MCW8086055.1 ABC transporter substrate-binding protein [Roseococcus sp. MDT2-1-1]
MRRRDLMLAAGAAPFAIHDARAQAARTLRVIPQANLTSLDPIWTTAVVTRNHGFLVYDTLTAEDSRGQVRPQMAEGWQVSDDRRTWTFTLREGLRFHDNEPVRSQDCIASIRRWSTRETFGQIVGTAIDEMRALDDRRFEIKLKRPFPLLALAIGRGQGPAFIMPERLASTDGATQVREATGSGPFRFLADQWNPGQRAVWARFDGYRPREEQPDGLAGGKHARVERVEWTVISDAATAANAMTQNEQDYWEYPLHDLLPLLRRSRDVVVEQRLLFGTYGCLRFNHLHPPFNNVAIRRAVAMAVDQRDYLRAVAGDDPNGWATCEGVFTCGTPMETEEGSEILKTRSVDRARAALREAGYNNERIVLITPSDYPQINALGLVTHDLLRRIGMNVELVATDWGTLVQRRNSREPPERGGWNIFHTTASGDALALPPVHLFLRSNGTSAWFGWPDDPEIERMRLAFLDAEDQAAQQQLAKQLNAQAMKSLPYVPLGYYWQPSAWNRRVTGAFRTPATVFWNIGKNA